MVTYIAMIVTQLPVTKGNKMRLLFLTLSFLILGCDGVKQEVKWQGRCFPHQFLSEGSFIKSNNGDTSFDNKVSEAPILFYPSDYIVNHIKEFKVFEYRNESKYNHFLPVNFQPLRKLDIKKDASLFSAFADAQDLYFLKNNEHYDLTLYTLVEGELLYWGSCYRGSVDSYSCFRTFEFGDVNIRYDVHKDNI
ncbi:hypothetical protein [Vibrio nereis]|uniref:hypothetical protein n=1 Tax=Vibrio nereis TaxID=693 RepID=UPI0024947A60|nr:hypothetical protein [Vibrio nereis]